MKRRAIVAIAIALVLLGVFVTLVGWNEVLGAIERTTPSVYAGAFVATLVCFGFRSAVWARVLTVVDEPRPYWLVLGVFLTASFVKYVTPYGQVASGVGTAAIVSRYTDAAYEESLAAVVSADVLNYLPYYTFGAVGLVAVVVLESPRFDPAAYVLPALALVGGVVVALAFLWFGRSAVREGILRVGSRLRGLVARVSERKARLLRREHVERRFEGFYATLELVSRNRRPMSVALVYAHVGWLGLAAALYVTALSLDAPVSVGAALLVVALSKLGFLVPTPGGIGGVEATLAATLFLVTPMGVAVATATAILYRFATYWFTVFVGGSTSMALTITDPTPPE